jgi:hypothetical protein
MRVGDVMLRKYPRTRHIGASRVQRGDEDLTVAPFEAIKGRWVVVEEKMDGANCALGFDDAGELRLHSRGHFLMGGPRERHFALLKQWAATHEDAWFGSLEGRYVCYGEWMYAKHTVFYDALPHYFLEFDVLDVESGNFLSTGRRAAVLRGVPVTPVRVLFEGILQKEEELAHLLGRSAFKTESCNQRLRAAAIRLGLDAEEALHQTDASDRMEGLYIKVEEEGVVKERYKFVRGDFRSRVADSESHWLARPIVPNELMAGVDLFGAPGGGGV